ncbi:H/ACA ribonucleoprotein complex non-core subunit NAF1 isoform X2 [Catharus ustulatus]|uniref:H/ACA ribonucleoprotein complex non-core subunit NAF1 isoform X2 n=1 Tax=Catharus ustulatus TaxID=91951 RepID=UPI00140E13C9|nr:H/ACA ribonucleoprotein complex non-core subunit NAF1 isoform X2 [Catharus ustulatus]
MEVQQEVPQEVMEQLENLAVEPGGQRASNQEKVPGPSEGDGEAQALQPLATGPRRSPPPASPGAPDVPASASPGAPGDAAAASPGAPGVAAPASSSSPGVPAPASPSSPGVPAPASPSSPGVPAPASPFSPGVAVPASPSSPGVAVPASLSSPGVSAPPWPGASPSPAASAWPGAPSSPGVAVPAVAVPPAAVVAVTAAAAPSSDSDSDSDSDSSSTTLFSSSSAVSDEDDHPNEKDNRFYCIRTKDELPIEELPPVEDLSIILPDNVELKVFGTVSSIIDQLVIIQSLRGLPPVNEESIIFKEDRQAAGKVLDFSDDEKEREAKEKKKKPQSRGRKKVRSETLPSSENNELLLSVQRPPSSYSRGYCGRGFSFSRDLFPPPSGPRGFFRPNVRPPPPLYFSDRRIYQESPVFPPPHRRENPMMQQYPFPPPDFGYVSDAHHFYPLPPNMNMMWGGPNVYNSPYSFLPPPPPPPPPPPANCPPQFRPY